MLSVSCIQKQFLTPQGPVPVLRDVSLSLAAGDTLALTGDSGSGKSTLLHLIAGLDTPDAGDIVVDNTRVTDLPEPDSAALRRLTVGLVFQQYNLIPSLTVAANLAFQARLAGRHDAEQQHRLVGQLGLQDLLARYPEQLSGGQQQRVAIGRTLAARPSLILADEPTGNLDQASGDAMLALFLELVADTGCALLMVTHSERLAERLNRRAHLTQGTIA